MRVIDLLVFEGVQEEIFQLDGPWGPDLQRGMIDRCSSIMQETGARTLLTGLFLIMVFALKLIVDEIVRPEAAAITGTSVD